MRAIWQAVTRSVTKIKTASFIAALTASLLLPVLADPNIAHATGGINNTRGDAWGTVEVPTGDSGFLSGGGVAIYSNGSQVSYTPNKPNNTVSGVVSGEEWQCVELVNRLFLTKGWITATTWTGNGGQLYDNAPGSLTKQLNGSITYLNPGDTLVLQDSGAGHAAIINTYNSGTGSIQIASQNTNVVYDSTFTLSGGTISTPGWGTYSIKGIVHHPVTTSPSTRPGALARSSTDMDTFYQNGTSLVDRYWNSTTGWASTSWSVNASSAPSAVARDSSDMDVLFRDTNNNLVDQHWNATSGWGTTTLVSDGSVRGNPHVIARDSGDMDVFYRDSSNKLADAHWNSGTGWGLSNWSDNVQGDPSPTDRSSGNMDIFFRNTSNNLIDRHWISTTGWGWDTLVSNGTIGGDPGAITPDSGHMDAFYKDSSTGNLYDRWWDSVDGWNTSSWSGSPDANAPSAIARDSNDIDVFYRNGSNNLIDQHWNVTNGWGTTTIDSSGHLSTDPSAITRDSADMDIFYGTSGGSLADAYWNSTNGWGGTTWSW